MAALVSGPTKPMLWRWNGPEAATPGAMISTAITLFAL
jgi:hypothetical protein